MAYLFDTNAISEVFRPRPNEAFVRWLWALPRQEQLTSTVVISELYTAAFRPAAPEARARWRERIDDQVLPRFTVLPFDVDCARECGRLVAHLAAAGTPIDTADAQIAATARFHHLTLVTGNARHFERVPDLALEVFTPGA